MKQKENDSATMTMPGHHRHEDQSKMEANDRRVEVELTCDAPQAERVFVSGDFNHWRPGEIRLRRDKTGIWQVELRLEPGRYEYRFVVDGEWQDDPHAPVRVANSFGSTNAVLEVKQ
jgi:1,4-alpha-glucan branching enzyme